MKKQTTKAIPIPTQSELNCQLLDAITDLRERMDKAESHIRALEATNDHLMDWLNDIERETDKGATLEVSK